jgi:hypothetical protein
LTSLDASTTGESRDLGQEFDLVVGIREIPSVDIEIITAWFNPGDAFGRGADDAFFLKVQVRYRF